jgi:hypothetical protein
MVRTLAKQEPQLGGGEFFQVSTRMPEWRTWFHTLSMAGRPIRYSASDIPVMPEEIQNELNASYCEYVLEGDNSVRFLVPVTAENYEV